MTLKYTFGVALSTLDTALRRWRLSALNAAVAICRRLHIRGDGDHVGKIRTMIWRLRRALGIRLVLWVMRRIGSSTSHCANRYEAGLTVNGYELFVQLRDLRRPDGFERTEVLLMLQKVRMAEAMQGWKCPDPGMPKRGQLILDGEAVDVLYFWEEPGVDDGPWARVSCAREIIAVTAEGKRRTLKQPKVAARA